MRWTALTALCLVGCLRPATKFCEDTGYMCPANQECAKAPVYCGSPGDVAACNSLEDYDPCRDTQGESGACRGGVCFRCSFDLGGCTYPGWITMGQVTTEVLNGVWTSSKGSAYAVGEAATVLRYDGFVWTKLPSPIAAGGSLKAVWGSDETNVLVVATDGSISRWNGDSWTVVATSPKPLNAIWGSSANDVFAVGLGGTIMHFDGVMWTTTESVLGLPAPLNGVWGDATDVFVVGNQNLILRYSRATMMWSISQPPTTGAPALLGVAGRSASDVYSVGLIPSATTWNVHHFDGTAWSPVPMLPTLAVSLYAVWVSADGEVFATGDATAALHFDRSSWMQSFVTTNNLAILRSVSGSSADNVFAVGDGGTVARYTGG